MAGVRRNISESVGIKGRNRPEDVDAIQEMLNIVPPFEGGAQPLLRVDGLAGSRTNRAIQVFQLHHFGWSGADGRVDPDQQSIRWLRSLEGQYSRQEFKLIICEKSSDISGISSGYYAIIGPGSAYYSFGPRPEPHPSQIVSRLTFSNNPKHWRTFQTQQVRGVRGFETRSATETIFHDHSVPTQSKILLQLDLPRADTRNDFVNVMVTHDWIHEHSRPSGFRNTRGSFHLLSSSFN